MAQKAVERVLADHEEIRKWAEADETADGKPSNSNKLVGRETVEAKR
jgi:hypothetical protein